MQSSIATLGQSVSKFSPNPYTIFYEEKAVDHLSFLNHLQSSHKEYTEEHVMEVLIPTQAPNPSQNVDIDQFLSLEKNSLADADTSVSLRDTNVPNQQHSASREGGDESGTRNLAGNGNEEKMVGEAEEESHSFKIRHDHMSPLPVLTSPLASPQTMEEICLGSLPEIMEQCMVLGHEESTRSKNGQKEANPLSIKAPPVTKKTKKETKPKQKTDATSRKKPLIEMVDESSDTAVHKKKKDQRKNMYGYSFKHIVRELFSQEYVASLEKICSKYGISEDDLISFYKQTLKWSIFLKDVFDLVNFNAHPADSLEYKIKRAFCNFYVWYLRKRYTIHILQSTDIEHKEDYLEAKRVLIYLPKLKKKKNDSTHPILEEGEL